MNVDAVNEIATSEANKLASRFKMVERDDIHGQIWQWILKYPEKVNTTLEEDPGALAFYMRTEGRKYCLTEKARIEGYSVQDLYYYSTKQLYELLPVVFEYVDWQPSGQSGDGQPRGKSDPKTGGNLVAMLADVSQGLLSLREHDYNVLVWRFKYDYSDEQLGLELGCTPETANKRIQRSVKSLQRVLGGTNPFVEFTGQRTAVSNASARARTSQSWEGE